jgi:glycosyl transferase family 1
LRVSRQPMASAHGSVLQLSMRRIKDLVAFCLPYEFEDVVAEVTGAERVEPDDFPALEFGRRVYKLGQWLTRSRSLARAMAPRPVGHRLDRDFDLFLPVFNNAFELFALFSVPDWRKRCRVAACFISEMWAHDVPEYLLEVLADFDHLFLGVRNLTTEVARIVGRPCTYLPLAVDVLRFAPWPDPPPRAIDVCNLGRRSPLTHEALLRLARERRIFYYYDTVRASGEGGRQMTFRVGNASEHRLLLASLLQRSRYFLANRARVNEPEIIEGKDEISSRFYEGVAAGAVLLGEPPQSAEFARQFDWQDAVIHLPFGATDVGEILAALDADPGRIERIRRDNVRHAALRHDWVHRLHAIFDVLNIPPTEAMLAREERLRSLAAAFAARGDGASSAAAAPGPP